MAKLPHVNAAQLAALAERALVELSTYPPDTGTPNAEGARHWLNIIAYAGRASLMRASDAEIGDRYIAPDITTGGPGKVWEIVEIDTREDGRRVRFGYAGGAYLWINAGEAVLIYRGPKVPA